MDTPVGPQELVEMVRALRQFYSQEELHGFSNEEIVRRYRIAFGKYMDECCGC